MKEYTEEELKGKFVVARDTMVDGNQCMMEGEEEDDDYGPLLFESDDEAFKEIFDGNHAMLCSHRKDDMLEEYNEGVTSEMVDEMGELLRSGDVAAMRKFMDEHPECNDSEEWVEPAETFIMNRKAFLGENGITITGTNLWKSDDE